MQKLTYISSFLLFLFWELCWRVGSVYKNQSIFSGSCWHLRNLINLFKEIDSGAGTNDFFNKLVRDDTHMTSMKTGKFSRPPNPLSSRVQNSSTHLTLNVQFQTTPPPKPSPNYNQSVKRKHNPRMNIACYQVFPSGRFLLSVSTH